MAVTAARSARRVALADANRLLAELDAKIEAGMAAYGIPVVAVGLLYGGREYLKGYGVTNVDHPGAVDPDTVFRVGSTTKVFTGTAVMRLVEQGKLDLNGRVRRYMPEFRSSDPGVAARVTLGELLRHTPGWLGNCFLDAGCGEDALARYVDRQRDGRGAAKPGPLARTRRWHRHAAFSAAPAVAVRPAPPG